MISNKTLCALVSATFLALSLGLSSAWAADDDDPPSDAAIEAAKDQLREELRADREIAELQRRIRKEKALSRVGGVLSIITFSASGANVATGIIGEEVYGGSQYVSYTAAPNVGAAIAFASIGGVFLSVAIGKVAKANRLQQELDAHLVAGRGLSPRERTMVQWGLRWEHTVSADPLQPHHLSRASALGR